ncbi:hypothetical protein [Burkholderia ubonensis]|uniref:hypothetical protein n=1 Tax=Burkholderia ubonensis TaxID=101571 RepID=UPI0012FBAA36|nr:hypothetical protein [Burkholderia ubonensis]
MGGIGVDSSDGLQRIVAWAKKRCGPVKNPAPRSPVILDEHKKSMISPIFASEAALT